MEYGLIGKKLGHSFSKEIHEKIGKYNYELVELDENQFITFMKEKKFKAINVTIPYKEKVIEYLDYITNEAKEIKAVNTIVNKDGILYGYNTDYLGLKEMINHFHIEVENQNAMILGNGGTCKTAKAVLNDLNVKSIKVVSLQKQEDCITYDMIDNYSKDIDLLINTTPKEMFPNNELHILKSLDGFINLKGLVDVVYNPLRTNLAIKAKNKKINYCTGLYMLIAQAFYAIEIFLDKKLDKTIIESIYKDLIKQKENIVLIGMPSSGKTTIGKKLAKITNKKFVDTDELIVNEIKMDIATYFSLYGQESFREIESKIIADISKQTDLIIATGGGSILKSINVDLLKQNGKLFFLNRSLDKLIVSDSRPLSSNRIDLENRYKERYNLYVNASDVIIDANKEIEEIVEDILGGNL